MSDDDDYDCPLCMEELDISDRNFRPCPCGYQICRFCWHHIKENLNGRCPACRRLYSEQTVEFTPISPEELTRIRKEKKEKERQQKEMEAANRKHLANMRVVQKNLVYVIGLNPKVVNEQILRQHDYFGQYGKIAKIVVNKRNPPPSTVPGAPVSQPSVGVYITYDRKEDAAKAIAAVDGSLSEGKVLRASYGTTKYCTYYLRNMACQNPGCMYLHEPGEDADSYTKEDLAIGKHHLRDHMSTSETPHKPQALGRPGAPAGPPSTFSPPTTMHHHIRKPIAVDTPVYVHKPINPKIEIAKALHINPVDDKSSDGEEKSALPATASWAKPSSNPSTPILKNQSLPDRSVTPENFGPPLAIAAAAAQKPKPQSSTAKRKAEDKEKQAKKSSAESKSATVAVPAVMEEKRERVVAEKPALDVKTPDVKIMDTKAVVKDVSHIIKPERVKELVMADKPLGPTEKPVPVEEEKVVPVPEEPPSIPVPSTAEQILKSKAPEGLAQYVLGSVITTEDIPEAGEVSTLEPLDESANRKQPEEKLAIDNALTVSSFSNPIAAMSSLPALPPLPPLPASTYVGSFNPFIEDSFGTLSRSPLPLAPGLGVAHGAGSIITSVQSSYNGTGFDPFKENDTVSSPLSPPQQQSAITTPPISGGRSRHTSRFGFAQDYPQSLPPMTHSPLRELPPHLGFNYANIAPTTHSLSALAGVDPRMDPTAVKSMQDGFRALLPNVNISFGTPTSAEQQAQLMLSNASGGGLWNSAVGGGATGLRDQETFATHHQLPITQTSPGFSHDYQYHQTLLLQQQHQHQQQQYQQQLAGLNPGLGGMRLVDNHDGHSAIVAPISVKSPPPGISFAPRTQWNSEGMQSMGNWTDAGQQSVASGPSMSNILPPPGVHGLPNRVRDEAQDFFGQFLKKAAATNAVPEAAARNHQNPISTIPFQDPAIMAVRISSPTTSSTTPFRPPQGNQPPLAQDPLAQLLASQSPAMPPQQQHFQHANTGGHRLRVFEGVARAGEEPQGGVGLGVGMGGGIMSNGMGLAAGSGVMGNNLSMGGYFGGDVAESASNRPPPLAGPTYATLTLGSEQQEHAQLDFNASSLDSGSENLSVLVSNQPEKTTVCDVNNQTAITEQQIDVNSASPNEIPPITSSKPSRKQRNKDKESPTSQSGLEVISASPKSQINPVEPSLKVTNSLKKQQQHQQLAANSTNDGRKVGTEQQRREPQDEKYKTVTQTEKDQKKNGNTASNSRTNSDTLQSHRGQAVSASNSHAVNSTISSGGKKKKKDKSKSATANINDVSSVATSAQQQPDAKDFSIDVIQVDGHTHIKEGHDIDSTSSTSKLFSVDDILDRINGTDASPEASVDSKLTSVGESDAPLDFGLKFDIPSSIFYSPPPPVLVSTPSTPGGAATSNGSFTPLSSSGGNLVSGASTPTMMTTTSLDELLSKDFGFSSSAFAWSANGLSGNGNGGVPHVRSSSPASVEALEREVENARKEAAMLENRLKAVINKNRMAMLSQ